MKPSRCTASDHIEAIRMFTTFFMWEDPRSESFLNAALPCMIGAKYIADNFHWIRDSLSEDEETRLIESLDQAAERMDKYKKELLNSLEKEMEDEQDEWD